MLFCALPTGAMAAESIDVFEKQDISQVNAMYNLDTSVLSTTQLKEACISDIRMEYVNLINGNSLLVTEIHDAVRQDLVSEVEKLYTNSLDWTPIVREYISVYNQYNQLNSNFVINPYSEGIYSSNNISLIFDPINQEVYLAEYYSEVLQTSRSMTYNGPTVPGQWFYTPTYLQGVDLYNILNQHIGEHRLEGYFRVNLRDTPEGFITEHYANQGGVYITTEEHGVVPNYSEKTCKLYMDTDARMLRGDINLFPVRWHFAIISNSIGGITYEGEQR